MSKQTTHLTVRVSPELRTEFNKRAYRFGKPADVLRQLIEAFVDDRLTIHPDPTKESLYVHRSPN